MATEQKKGKLVEYRKSSPRCSFIKEDHTQCKGIASNKTGMCPVHSGFVPALANKKVDLTVSSDFVSIKKYLIQLSIDTRRGKVKPLVANSITNQLNTVLKIEEDLILQQEIKEMQTLLEEIKNSNAYPGEVESLPELEEGL